MIPKKALKCFKFILHVQMIKTTFKKIKIINRRTARHRADSPQ